MKVYQSETNEYVDMEVIGYVRFVGASFGVDELTSNSVYPVVEADDDGFLRVVDDSSEDYLYAAKRPGPFGTIDWDGRWEIIEDPTGEIESVITAY